MGPPPRDPCRSAANIFRRKGRNVSEQRTEHNVQLGCGTLIIIALIVMFFSGGRDSEKLGRHIDDLRQKVDGLERKIDELSQKVDRQSPTPQAAAEKE
jgi:outer membrane murein-binding lipoprotein Lpp